MTPRDETVVAARRLTKIYGRRVGCLEVDLEVGRGEIFGLLGPNGAGKSTLVRLLLGLLRPTAGEARLLGRWPGPPVLRRAGYLPELFRYPEWATAAEVLGFHAALLGIERPARAAEAGRVLARVGLAGAGGLRVGAMSKGMQQRLGLAVALLGDPVVIFLDEPTSALDPVGRREVRRLLGELRREGKTIFLNSHLLTEVEMVCDRVAVMRAGRVAAAGRLEELLPPADEVEVRLGWDSLSSADVAAAAARAGWRPAHPPTPEITGPAGGTQATAAGQGTVGRWRFVPGTGLAAGEAEDRAADGDRPFGTEAAEAVPALVAALVAAGARVYEVRPLRRTLEDLFVELVGGAAAEASGTGTPGGASAAPSGADTPGGASARPSGADAPGEPAAADAGTDTAGGGRRGA